MGRADDLRAVLAAQLENPQVYPNRLCDVEGSPSLPGTSAEHEGRAVAGLLRGLLLAAPPAPGEEPVVRLFGALPAAWDAAFQLLAPGGFTITAGSTRQVVHDVLIESSRDATLHLRNPWPGATVAVTRNRQPASPLAGAVLTISARPGERIRLARQ
jgi:hypothetical protein